MAGADSNRAFAKAVAWVAVPKSLGKGAVSEFKQALDQALALPEVRVVVLRGDAKGFCSGMDLSEIAEGNPNPEGDGEQWRAATESFVDLLETLLYAAPITLCVIEGPALGGGTGLLAACDLVLATEQATFALPELLLGLVPAMILPVLAERLGLHQAKRWAITQATWQAGEANQRGLVDQLVSVEGLDAQLKRTLRTLTRLHPRGVTALKRFTRALEQRELSAAMRKGQALLSGLLSQPLVRSEIVAFRDYGILPGDSEH